CRARPALRRVPGTLLAPRAQEAADAGHARGAAAERAVEDALVHAVAGHVLAADGGGAAGGGPAVADVAAILGAHADGHVHVAEAGAVEPADRVLVVLAIAVGGAVGPVARPDARQIGEADHAGGTGLAARAIEVAEVVGAAG